MTDTTLLIVADGMVFYRIGFMTDGELTQAQDIEGVHYLALRPTEAGTQRWFDYCPTQEERARLDEGLEDEASYEYDCVHSRWSDL